MQKRLHCLLQSNTKYICMQNGCKIDFFCKMLGEFFCQFLGAIATYEIISRPVDFNNPFSRPELFTLLAFYRPLLGGARNIQIHFNQLDARFIIAKAKASFKADKLSSIRTQLTSKYEEIFTKMRFRPNQQQQVTISQQKQCIFFFDLRFLQNSLLEESLKSTSFTSKC